MHHLCSVPDETKSPGSASNIGWCFECHTSFLSYSLYWGRSHSYVCGGPCTSSHLAWHCLCPKWTALKWPEFLLSNSYDGVPFLMHDSTLSRTTNIKEVYPNATAQNAALFSWDALKELNAGTWFLKVSTVKDNHQFVVEDKPAGYYLLGWILEGKFLVEPEQSQYR